MTWGTRIAGSSVEWTTNWPAAGVECCEICVVFSQERHQDRRFFLSFFLLVQAYQRGGDVNGVGGADQVNGLTRREGPAKGAGVPEVFEAAVAAYLLAAIDIVEVPIGIGMKFAIVAKKISGVLELAGMRRRPSPLS